MRLSAQLTIRLLPLPPTQISRPCSKQNTELVTIFGKSWTVHVKEALHTTPERNLQLISDSIGFLRQQGKTVFYDAEHFFDGFNADPNTLLPPIWKGDGGRRRVRHPLRHKRRVACRAKSETP